MDKSLGIIGKKFGHLTILKKMDRDKRYKLFVECRCDCGQIVRKRFDHVKSGRIIKCSQECRGMPFKEWFYSKTRKEGNKILWTGYCFPSGYGCVSYKNRNCGAHRLAWILEYGDIPDGLFVLHKNDCPQDVNVENLYLGNHQQNMTDKVNRHRQPVGEINGNSKLTREQVQEIRYHYTGKRGELPILSRAFNISISTIHQIVTNKTWKEEPSNV